MMEPDCQFFTTFDAVIGYSQVPLAATARRLTAFVIPLDQYNYKSAPLGLIQGMDIYSNKTDNIFQLAKVPATCR